MIYKILFYFPYFIIGVLYFNCLKGRKKLVNQLKAKDKITDDDKINLKGILLGEYMFLISGVLLISYEIYHSIL
ncbi:MAG: hypothetical protein AB8F94_20080 [Saprospiraceae bacterium]